jgi:hypothetical protein
MKTVAICPKCNRRLRMVCDCGYPGPMWRKKIIGK